MSPSCMMASVWISKQIPVVVVAAAAVVVVVAAAAVAVVVEDFQKAFAERLDRVSVARAVVS